MKKVFILRSCSGSGKSTFAKFIAACVPGSVICSADHFFENETGEYNFNHSLLGEAHKSCRNKFLEALKDDSCSLIIIDNTNCKPSDFKFYEEESRASGAEISYIILENRHGNSDIHGVPIETKERQEKNIRNSMILFSN